MNLVIPLLNSSNYNQLRFALRSITKHHSIDNCILVGGKPTWYKGDHITHKDYGPVFKEHNIRDKTLTAARTFTGEFMFANDDHILLAPLTTTYNKGLLSECLSKRVGTGSYTRCLQNTFDYYGDVQNTDTHCPMIMDAAGVDKTAFDWPQFGIGFKTAYCQENGIESEYYPDCKVASLKEVRSRLWFSMNDNFPVKDLFAYFPDKCKFEL